MTPLPNLQPHYWRSSIANRHCSESDICEQTFNFESPTLQNPLTKIAEDYHNHEDFSAPYVPVSPKAKLVQVDNDTVQVLEIMLRKHLREEYDSEKAAIVAWVIFNTLPAVEDETSGEDIQASCVVGLEEFGNLAKGWALRMAAKSIRASSSSPKDHRKKADVKKTQKRKKCRKNPFAIQI